MMRCVEKSEFSFNIRASKHRKDVKKPDAILACRHFQEKIHVFKKHAKFIIIGKLTNTTKSKDILHKRLIERENFDQLCMPYHKNVKPEFIQKYIFLYKTSYAIVKISR